MEFLKEELNKLNKDILLLKEEVYTLKKEIFQLRSLLFNLNNNSLSTESLNFKTHPSISPTEESLFKSLKDKKVVISIGNRGVQTDRQTDQQTDKRPIFEFKMNENPLESIPGLLSSLDNLKKEVRLKFKRLTEQEILVFSAIYQLEEEKGLCKYKDLSNKLSLTESSIRDYVRRLILKGIPIEKTKIHNKEVLLSISPNLKKIASLNTILELRNL